MSGTLIIKKRARQQSHNRGGGPGAPAFLCLEVCGAPYACGPAPWCGPFGRVSYGAGVPCAERSYTRPCIGWWPVLAGQTRPRLFQGAPCRRMCPSCYAPLCRESSCVESCLRWSACRPDFLGRDLFTTPVFGAGTRSFFGAIFAGCPLRCSPSYYMVAARESLVVPRAFFRRPMGCACAPKGFNPRVLVAAAQVGVSSPFNGRR